VGTGGSRYGAGRPGWRRRCEQSLPLDIRHLQRRGVLRSGSSSGWYWSCGGEPRGDIGLTCQANSIRLSYTWTPYGGEPKQMSYDFALVRTQCHYGGTRPWFLCRWCGRRVAVLYGLSGDGYFGCRHCLRLGYLSDSMDLAQRLHRKMAKLRDRLDENEGRPKWMRWRTFERIHERMDHVDAALDSAFCARAFRLFGIAATSIKDLL